MKKLLISILALLSFSILEAQKPIIISGKIINCMNRGNAHIEKRWFNPETLQEESTSNGFTISDDGSFSVKISDADNYYHRYWIYLGNEFTHLDLIAGDSINMTLNAVYFDESITYKGIGAGRNNYRRDVFLAFWNDDAMLFNNERDGIRFLFGLNAFTKRRLQLLELYYKSGEIDLSYYKIEKTLILNDKADLLLSRMELFENQRSLPAGVSAQINSILDGVNLSDEHNLQHSQFRSLVEKMPDIVLDRKLIKPEINLKREIEYADKNYPKLVKLYYDKTLMEAYISQANTLSENTELLNYFEKQFNEPALVKAIMNYKYMCVKFKGAEFLKD